MTDLTPERTKQIVKEIESVNKRRFFLIETELRKGLTAKEENELESLQLAVDELVDQIAPLPEMPV